MAVGLSSVLLSKFFWSGGFSIFYNLFSDLKTRTIDDRWNYYGLGVVTVIYSLLNPKNMLVRILLPLFLVGFVKGMADGDKSALRWILMGFFAFSWFLPFVFLWFLVFYTAVLQTTVFILRRVGYPIKKVPYYGVILGAFITTAVV